MKISTWLNLIPGVSATYRHHVFPNPVWCKNCHIKKEGIVSCTGGMVIVCVCFDCDVWMKNPHAPPSMTELWRCLEVSNITVGTSTSCRYESKKIITCFTKLEWGLLCIWRQAAFIDDAQDHFYVAYLLLFALDRTYPQRHKSDATKDNTWALAWQTRDSSVDIVPNPAGIAQCGFITRRRRQCAAPNLEIVARR